MRKGLEFITALKEDKNALFIAIGYIPILGWFFPLFLGKRDAFTKFHAKQATALSLYTLFTFIIFRICVMLFGAFGRALVTILFALNCALALYFAFRAVEDATLDKKKFHIPFIGNFVDTIDL